MGMRTKKFLKRLAAALTISLMMAAVFCPAASASFTAKINSSSAKVYTSATSYYRGFRNLKVSVTAYRDGWARIRCGGRTGYTQIRNLNLTSRITAYTSTTASVYKRASSSASKLGTLAKASTVYVIGVDGSFCRIQDRSASITGYIRTSCLTAKKPSSASSVSTSGSSSVPAGLKSTVSSYSSGMSKSSRLEYAIYGAQNMLNRPYANSANPPYSFNCSILTYYCMHHAGFSIKDTAHLQGYDDRYTKVSYSNLKRGDLVFFNTVTSDDDECDHVGIYLGSGYFIHASSSAGKVIISSMKSGYYKSAFSWGRRL